MLMHPIVDTKNRWTEYPMTSAWIEILSPGDSVHTIRQNPFDTSDPGEEFVINVVYKCFHQAECCLRFDKRLTHKKETGRRPERRLINGVVVASCCNHEIYPSSVMSIRPYVAIILLYGKISNPFYKRVVRVVRYAVKPSLALQHRESREIETLENTNIRISTTSVNDSDVDTVGKVTQPRPRDAEG